MCDHRRRRIENAESRRRYRAGRQRIHAGTVEGRRVRIRRTRVRVNSMAELNLVEKVIALEGVELLGALAPDHLATVATVATEVQVPPGRVILEPAKPVEALYIVLDGSVEVMRDGSVLDTVGQNSVLGAWALFGEDDPIALTARALSDTHLLRIEIGRAH